MTTTSTSWSVAGTAMYMCRPWLPYDNTWNRRTAYTNIHFITTTVTQLPRTPLPLRRAIQQPTAFFLYLWDPALLPFSRTGRLELLNLFPFSSLISHGNRRKKQTAPSTAKGKRKCDDTNSTYEHTRTRKQHKVNICCGSGFFSPASLFFCFTCFFILFVIRGMEESGGNRAGIHDRGSREERKKEREKGPSVAQADTHEGVLWQLLALSRLVRSSLSFLPRLRGRGGRQNAIDDSVTGSLSGF